MPDPIFPPSSRHQPGIPPAILFLVIAVLAFGAGFAAVVVQSHFAPVGLFPIVVGAITGLGAGVLWYGQPRKSKRIVMLSALAAGCICLATLHYGSYVLMRLTQHKNQPEVPPEIALIDPEIALRQTATPTFGAYMTKEWRRGRYLGAIHVTDSWLGLWWGLDALAIVGMAMFTARLSSGTAGSTEPPSTEPPPGETNHDSGATP